MAPKRTSPAKGYKVRTSAKKSDENVLSKLFSKKLLPVWLVLFGTAGVYLTFFSHAATFQYIGKFPQAATQPTSYGRMIHTLKAYNGKIYAGYGDWDQNTGPVALTPYDPASSTFAPAPEFYADTETIDLFHEYDSKLYAASIDPRTSNDYTVGAASGSTVTWSGYTPMGMAHDFDFASLGPNDLWLAGSKDLGSGYDHAVVYHSTDGGKTWVLSLDVAGSSGKHARFYMIGAYQGKLYTQAIEFGNDLVASLMPKSKVYASGKWSDGPSLANPGFYYHATEFAGKMVFQTNPQGGSLVAFDGRSSSYLKAARNYTIGPDGYLYLLGSDNTVSKTKDLVNWQQVALAPSNSSAIEILDGYIYIGTYDSELYRASLLNISSDVTPPSGTITTPVAGTTVSGTVPIAVTAADNSGVGKVELYVDGKLKVTLSTAPYSYSWNTVGYANGAHVLKAIVYDSSLNSAATPEVSVNVANAVSSDATAPSVYSVQPTSGSLLKGQVTLKGSASDNVGVARMELLLDGKVVTTNNSSASISLKTSTRDLAPGQHTITVNAYDAAGNMGTRSSTVTK